MNEIDYSDSAELFDWNTHISGRFLKLLKADGITTFGDLMVIQPAKWANETKGAGGRAIDQIAATQTMVVEKRRRIRVETAEDFGAIRVADGLAAFERELFEPREELGRASLIDRAVHALGAINLVLEGGVVAEERKVGLAQAMIRTLLMELSPDPIAERVPRDEVIRAMLDGLQDNISADPVTLFDNVTWAIDAITGNGWLIVRAESLQV